MPVYRMFHEISARFPTFIRFLHFTEIFGVNMVLNLGFFVVTCTQPPIGGYFVYSLGKFFYVYMCICVCVWGGEGLLMSQTTESTFTFSFICRFCDGKAPFRMNNEGAAFVDFTTQAERFSYLSVSWSEAGITIERDVQTPHSVLRRYTAEVQRVSKGNFQRIACQMHTLRTQLLRTSNHECLYPVSLPKYACCQSRSLPS